MELNSGVNVSYEKHVEISHLGLAGIHIYMNWQNIIFDWNHMRAFLVAAEEGSLSAAARALGLTQPTLSRQVSALEAELGVTLFERGHRELNLTRAGAKLLEQVRVMGDSANRISLIAASQSAQLAGRVSVTGSDVISTYHLPAMIKKLNAQAPNIQVELIASNKVLDLYKREADIAIRHFRPDHKDLITRLIDEPRAHLYAASAYLDEIGRSPSVEVLNKARFIGFESKERSLHIYNSLGLSLTEDNFQVLCDNGVVSIEMLKQGLGMGLVAEATARLIPGIERVMLSAVSLTFPVWLTTHRELHTSPRIRFVYDVLAAELAAIGKRAD